MKVNKQKLAQYLSNCQKINKTTRKHECLLTEEERLWGLLNKQEQDVLRKLVLYESLSYELKFTPKDDVTEYERIMDELDYLWHKLSAKEKAILNNWKKNVR